MDEHTGGELAWFRRAVISSLVRPRAFAGTLAREHYGLAGVAVALASGLALSVAIDWLVLSARGFDPLGYVGRLVLDAVFVGVRLAVTAAAVALLAVGALRVLRREAATLDQVYTAIGFALAPVLVTPALAGVLALFPETLAVVGALAVVVLVRVLFGLALHLGAILPRPLAAIAFAVVLASGSFALADQISRVRMTVYAYAPALAPALEAGPAQGALIAGDTYRLSMPARWRNATSGVPGEAARFVTDTDTLSVTRVRGDPFLTADSYADNVRRGEVRGMDTERTDRRVVRSATLVMVDDVTRGTYEGRRLLLRRFTAAAGPQVMALVFRYIEPADEAAALAESATIAASWELSAR